MRITALGVLIAAALACAAPPPVSTSEVEAVLRDAIPEDPADAIWKGAPAHIADLLLQDLVEPRLLVPSTARVEVRAVTDGGRLALLMRWRDVTIDDLPGPMRFSDACAVQIPQRTEADVPDPQMGHAGRPVEIAFWRASWQASVAGRPDTIRAIHPGAVVDHYPFEAPSLEPGSPARRAFETRYAPAAAAGNRREGPRESPVEDLIAEGPGTLSPAPAQVSRGTGRRSKDGWEVVIVRPLPAGLEAGQRTQIAFGVWDGAHGESGSRKMRTGWVPLAIAPGAAPGGS